jgi:hypothetical protein
MTGASGTIRMPPPSLLRQGKLGNLTARFLGVSWR